MLCLLTGPLRPTMHPSSGTEDDSPTLMLPADMVLDRRMHDDSAESETV
jgi:hypothetical protein